MRRTTLIALLASLALLTFSIGAQAARPLTLRVVRAYPLTLHGANFRRGETVRVVVLMDTRRWSQQTRAGPAGGFIVRFRRVTLNYCAIPLSISARGERSGVVQAKIPPRECASP